MKLRDYQTNLINATRQAFRDGYKRPLVVLPCGAGKTVLFAYMAHEHANRGGYVHFYVHRRELLDQTLDTFASVGIPTDNIYVGTVQRRTPHEIPPTMIVFDECHHATAKQWTNIIERYPDAYIVGLTATPTRLDGRNLADIFDILIEGVDTKWLIKNKYLAPFDYYAPKLSTISERDFIVRGNDFDNVAIGDIMLKRKIYGDILKYIDPKRKTIIYAPSVAFSQSLEAYGVAHLDGTTPDNERRRIVEAFKRGEIMALSNVDLFGEGFDVPDCEVVILLRPTQSTALYIQQTMRAMRYKPDKRATVYDLVGNVFTHGLPDDYKNWQLDAPRRSVVRGGANEVLMRECKKCLLIYRGIKNICPYCGHDNGQTQAEIKQAEAELERIEGINKRREVGMTGSLEDLIKLGRSRGYKNPEYWARMIYSSRENKRRKV